MPDDRWQRVKELFQAAAERAVDERAAFLDQACGEDSSLRAEVEELLQADRQDGFLASPATTPLDLTPDRSDEQLAGTRVGPYRLERVHASGGMGTVYLAARADGQFEQNVAIKLIKRGMDSEAIVRRFRHERQTLARLDHHNIARLFDGGITEAGQPYFVMEYAAGLPIDVYCEDRALSVEQRLHLFRDVCGAVHHAHQKLVIHRDLKPTNIQVNQDGVVKLLDFGIAKVFEERSEEGLTLPNLTETGMRLMTPEYASPEQVMGAEVTTATDVYSLGIILYELLTGRRPYEIKTRSPKEIERIVCEQVPLKPSTAVRQTGDGQTKQRRLRRIDFGLRNRRKLIGDLDTIVMMALRKEPHRRYASVHQFSEDIRRYLEGLPVIARKDTLVYRLSKLVRRHRASAVAALLVLASLVGGMLTTAWQARVAQAAKLEAEQREALAQRYLYAVHMNLAQEAWENSYVPRVLELLELHRPRPGQDDLRGFEWYLLWQMCHGSLALPFGNGPIRCVAYAPDGESFVSVDESGMAVIWDAETLEPGFTSDGLHDGEIYDVCFSPDGRTLATCGEDGLAHLWDYSARELRLTLKGHAGSVSALAFSPYGELVATGSDDGTVKLWHAATGKCRHTLPGQHGRIYSVSFSPDGATLATGGENGSITLWDVARQASRKNIAAHEEAIGCLAFNPAGDVLASASEDRTVKLWSVADGEGLDLSGEGWHWSEVTCVAFSPDGQVLASASLDATIKLWSVPDGKALKTLRGHEDGVYDVAFSPDGQWLVSGGLDETVRRWAPLANEYPTTLGPDDHQAVALSAAGARIRSRTLLAVAVSPVGNVVATVGDDAGIRLWDPHTGQAIATLAGSDDAGGCIAFSPDGQTVAVGHEQGRVVFWDTASRKRKTVVAIGHGGVRGLAFSPDGTLLATANEHETVALADLRADGQSTTALEGHADRVNAVAFSPDGRWLVSAGEDGTAIVWDLATHTAHHELSAHTEGVVCTAVSPDGALVVTGARDSSALIWDLQTGQVLHRLSQHTGEIYAVAFSLDGKTLVTGSQDEELKFWDPLSGEQRFTIYHDAEVHFTQFSSDGSFLAVAGSDQTVKVWHAPRQDSAADADR